MPLCFLVQVFGSGCPDDLRTLKALRSIGVASSQCVPARDDTRFVASKTLPVARWMRLLATKGVGDRQDARVRRDCILV